MATALPLYSDLDMSLMLHPLSGDIVPKKNDDAIKRSIRNIVFLEPFDVPFEPDKASGLRQFLFENTGQLMNSSVEATLKWLVNTMEPRVTVQRIESEFVDKTLKITMYYQIRSLMQDDVFQFVVQRIR